MNSLAALFALVIIGAAAFPQEDQWAETAVSADPGGMPSDLIHGCGATKGGTQGKCSSDVFCPAMPDDKIEKKTKLDCIWGTSKTEDNAASAMSAKGSIAEVYEKTGKCEYSVYGNPCAWKETMAYCESLRGKPMGCPWYCNKEELYCAARYLNPSYSWPDKIGIVPTGKCTGKDKYHCCSWQLDARYDAKCDPMNWNFVANEKKKKHCRAHAFSRSCNYYYDAALKIYEAKQGSAGGKKAHDANCVKSLAFHSCSPFKEPFLGDGYCKSGCGQMSERDGQSGMADSYKNDNGCCDTYAMLVKKKAMADKAEQAKKDAAIANGSCKDDPEGLVKDKDWGAGYKCADNKASGYCEYAYVDDMKKYCAATCKLCGAATPTLAATPEQLEATAKSMQLVAERMRSRKNGDPNEPSALVQKYLVEGYPDLPELNRA